MFQGWRIVAVSALAQAVSIGTTFYAYGAFMKPLAAEFGASRLAVTLGVAVMLLYPYSWFLYGVVYSDALFLAAILAASLAVESDRIVLAGLLTVIATADRPTGVSIAIGLTVLVAERRGVLRHDPETGPALVRRFRFPNRVDVSRLRRRDGAILLGFAGLAGIYLAEPLPLLTLAILVGVFGQIAIGIQIDAFSAELFPTAYRATSSAMRFMTGIVVGAIGLVLQGLVLAPWIGFGPSVLVLLLAAPLSGSPALPSSRAAPE